MNKIEIIDSVFQEIQAWQHFNQTHNIEYKSINKEKKAFLREQQMLCYPYDVIKEAVELYFKQK
jgi:hypothetical protein